jgi:probable HAF family extracellular repeat protein
MSTDEDLRREFALLVGKTVALMKEQTPASALRSPTIQSGGTMQSRILTCITAVAAFAALTAPVRSIAQNQQTSHKQRYSVTNLGTLGGTFSAGNGINNRGWVTGAATLANNTEHAAFWIDGLTFDLGTLGGPNSSVPFTIKDDRGYVAGIADTATMDPAHENFCAFGDGYECEAFLWRNGVMTQLPNTLGGNNSRAAGANNPGQIVGWAENTTQDPTCISPAVYQYKPVVWGPKNGQMQVLPTLSGDPDGAAVAINNKGQIVGISGPCGDDDGMGAAHPVLWQNGKVTKLASFGGKYFNTAAAINQKGLIAGWADLANDTALCVPACHAVLWTTSGGFKDLGTLPGDLNSLAYGVNEQGQVVGQSIDANGNTRAFIWQDDVMTDLNSLVPHGSQALAYAGDINDRGEITGGSCVSSSGSCAATSATTAFLATPKRDARQK